MTPGRLANVRDKGVAFLHGALVWGVSLTCTLPEHHATVTTTTMHRPPTV